MTDDVRAAVPPEFDLGDYCRRVEEHLARVNEGHLVRIAGMSFDLVRQWANAGIPLSIVCYGIDRKAERHRGGASRRPLRLEFCEGDVREAFEHWRRAVGVTTGRAVPGTEAGEPAAVRKRPSLARQIDRASERLVRAAGRLDTPASLREAITAHLEALVAVREDSRQARGETREGLLARLRDLDRTLGEAVRSAVGTDLTQVRERAADDLAPYRTRLAPEAWIRGVDAGVDRLLREQFGLPTLDPDEM